MRIQFELSFMMMWLHKFFTFLLADMVVWTLQDGLLPSMANTRYDLHIIWRGRLIFLILAAKVALVYPRIELLRRRIGRPFGL